MMPAELPENCCGCRQAYTGYSKVFVQDDKLTFSGGRRGRMETQTLELHRGPEGELYLDRQQTVTEITWNDNYLLPEVVTDRLVSSKGTLCTEFSPETGQVRPDCPVTVRTRTVLQVRASNALGFSIVWRRQGGVQPVSSQPASLSIAA